MKMAMIFKKNSEKTSRKKKVYVRAEGSGRVSEA
jgi:hypothetical protein